MSGKSSDARAPPISDSSPHDAQAAAGGLSAGRAVAPEHPPAAGPRARVADERRRDAARRGAARLADAPGVAVRQRPAVARSPRVVPGEKRPRAPDGARP